MNLLWFNWRDISNPAAGGAELFTHEVAKRLVRKGHNITLFTTEFSGCNRTEDIEGVHVIRNGGLYSVYSKAKHYYKSHKDDHDLVIDEINTRPFLTPKYVKGKPILALIHQLAREFWFYETPFPLSYIGYYYLENHWLSYYKDVTTVTVSESSMKDLLSLGFQNVLIIPEGLSITPLPEVAAKEEESTLVFVGRLKKAKLPDHAIKAFGIIRKEIPNAKMWVVGNGYMMAELKRLGSTGVTFFGKIPNEMRNNLVSRAHLLLTPAVREGWGLVVTESNALGTPAVGYNVNGLRDSINDGRTGILTLENTPEELARSAIDLLHDDNRLASLSKEALEFSRKYNWDHSAEEFQKAIFSTVEMGERTIGK